MIKAIIIFFLITISNSIKAQFNSKLNEFYRLKDTAELYEVNNSLDTALYYYKQMLTYSEFQISKIAYASIFQIYLKKENFEEAKKYLSLSILNTGPKEKDWFEFNAKQKFKFNLDSVNNKSELNNTIANSISKLIIRDQYLREMHSLLVSNKSCNSSTIFNYYDSLNYSEVKNTILEIGHIPTINEVGTTLQSAFTFVLVQHHFYKDTTFWTEKFKLAIDRGEISNTTLPFLLDEYHLHFTKEKKMIYNVYPNFENPNQYGESLYPENIDQLRSIFYLPPLILSSKIEKMDLPNNYIKNK